jgi:hypothetical protein
METNQTMKKMRVDSDDSKSKYKSKREILLVPAIILTIWLIVLSIYGLSAVGRIFSFLGVLVAILLYLIIHYAYTRGN